MQAARSADIRPKRESTAKSLHSAAAARAASHSPIDRSDGWNAPVTMGKRRPNRDAQGSRPQTEYPFPCACFGSAGHQRRCHARRPSTCSGRGRTAYRGHHRGGRSRSRTSRDVGHAGFECGESAGAGVCSLTFPDNLHLLRVVGARIPIVSGNKRHTGDDFGPAGGRRQQAEPDFACSQGLGPLKKSS